MINFAAYNAGALASAMAVMMILAWGGGRLIGRRLRDDLSPPAQPVHEFVSGKLSPYITLFGLLLGFTFSISLSRHESRVSMVVADSNAIGDFYTCASLLKDPVRTQLQAVVRQYAALHLKMARQRLDRSAWENALRSNRILQYEMTKLVSDALNQGTPIAVPLTNTLDGVSSASAARLAAVEERVPGTAVLLLFVLAIVTMALNGLELGRSGACTAAEAIGTLSFIFLIALAVFVTLDLDQPDRGLITVSQAPIDRLVSSMSK